MKSTSEASYILNRNYKPFLFSSQLLCWQEWFAVYTPSLNQDNACAILKAVMDFVSLPKVALWHCYAVCYGDHNVSPKVKISCSWYLPKLMSHSDSSGYASLIKWHIQLTSLCVTECTFPKDLKNVVFSGRVIYLKERKHPLLCALIELCTE